MINRKNITENPREWLYDSHNDCWHHHTLLARVRRESAGRWLPEYRSNRFGGYSTVESPSKTLHTAMHVAYNRLFDLCAGGC